MPESAGLRDGILALVIVLTVIIIFACALARRHNAADSRAEGDTSNGYDSADTPFEAFAPRPPLKPHGIPRPRIEAFAAADLKAFPRGGPLDMYPGLRPGYASTEGRGNVSPSAPCDMRPEQIGYRDIDERVTGQLYVDRVYLRQSYTAPHSGEQYGLQEYNTSSGIAGEVGVDQGPLGLDGYGGDTVGAHAGMPVEYLPADVRTTYTPDREDHYGAEGATPYSKGLYSLSVPDHDPLTS